MAAGVNGGGDVVTTAGVPLGSDPPVDPSQVQPRRRSPEGRQVIRQGREVDEDVVVGFEDERGGGAAARRPAEQKRRFAREVGVRVGEGALQEVAVALGFRSQRRLFGRRRRRPQDEEGAGGEPARSPARRRPPPGFSDGLASSGVGRGAGDQHQEERGGRSAAAGGEEDGGVVGEGRVGRKGCDAGVLC